MPKNQFVRIAIKSGNLSIDMTSSLGYLFQESQRCLYVHAPYPKILLNYILFVAKWLRNYSSKYTH